jgi:MoaA/NifB/PqqE/SkfB family radical SAM enzyme
MNLKIRDRFPPIVFSNGVAALKTIINFRNIKAALYYRNQFSGRHIRWVMIYATNRCNACCKHCRIWVQNPKIDLNPEVVEGIVKARCTNSRFYPTSFGLEGGEFLLHPKYKEILDLVKDRDYLLLSNAMLDDLLIDTVREFGVKRLHVSLDGTRETHKRVRGVDLFDKVDHVVNEVRDQTEITLVYTASPWNSCKDFLFVKDYCKKKGIGFAISIFADFRLFDVNDAFEKKPNVLQGYDLKTVTNPYMRCYQNWLEGDAKVPCQSPLCRIVVYPNGDLPFCCHKKILLGNLYEKSLDEIWYSEETKRTQKQFIGFCNDCWISFHRPVDFFYIEMLNRCFPKFVVKKMVGDYSYKCPE